MTSAATGAPIRVLLAVGDRDLGRRLLHALPDHGLVVAARCLDGTTLVEAARGPGIDVVLLSTDLHDFTTATLAAVSDRQRPVVVLSDVADPGPLASHAQVLPASSSINAIVAAVMTAEERGPTRPMPDTLVAPANQTIPVGSGSILPITPPDEAMTKATHGRVVAVTSGKGGPGKTTVAISLAAGIGARGEHVVLVDADRRGGNVAPMLDLDPRRGLVGLVSDREPVEALVETELQAGPRCAVLAGFERPAVAGALRPGAIGAAVTALRAHAAWVVVDLAEAGLHLEDAILRNADDVILVVGADLLGVWNARLALALLREAAGGTPISAVVNRREGREHYDRDEIAQALGIPVLAVVAEDRPAARRAISEQVPLADTGGRAARDLRAFVVAVCDAPPAAAPIAAAAPHLAMEL